MRTVAAIGDERRLAGYALAGAFVRHAVTREDAEAALAALNHEVGLVVLTPEAQLEETLAGRGDVVWAVVPS